MFKSAAAQKFFYCLHGDLWYEQDLSEPGNSGIIILYAQNFFYWNLILKLQKTSDKYFSIIEVPKIIPAKHLFLLE